MRSKVNSLEHKSLPNHDTTRVCGTQDRVLHNTAHSHSAVTGVVPASHKNKTNYNDTRNVLFTKQNRLTYGNDHTGDFDPA